MLKTTLIYTIIHAAIGYGLLTAALNSIGA